MNQPQMGTGVLLVDALDALCSSMQIGDAFEMNKIADALVALKWGRRDVAKRAVIDIVRRRRIDAAWKEAGRG